MELLPEKRFGIFLIAISIWYLVNLKIFDALQPILAVPGSVTFLAGLWLVLSPFTPTVSTSFITKLNTLSQTSAPASTKPVGTRARALKSATKAKPKITKKIKTTPLSVKKHVRKKKTKSKSGA